MQINLKVQSGNVSDSENIRRISLSEGECYNVGRAAENNWVIQDETVSGHHFELRVTQGKLLLVDHSSYGTYLDNGTVRLNRGQPTILSGAHSVQAGTVKIWVSIEAADAGAVSGTEQGKDVWGLASLAGRTKAASQAGGVSSPFSSLKGQAASEQGQLGVAREQRRPRTPSEAAGRALDMQYKPPGQQRLAKPSPNAQRSNTPPLDNNKSDDGFVARAPAMPPELTNRERSPAALNDDDELFEVPRTGGGRAPPGAVVPEEADPFADLFEPPSETSAAEPVQEPQGFPNPASKAGLSALRHESDGLGQPSRDITNDAPAPVQVQPPDEVPAVASADPDEFARRLFETIGLDADEYSHEERLALAAEIGTSFVSMADGLRLLLHERRDAKLQLGLTNTVIEPGLNPLKWAPNAAAAVDGILVNRSRGTLRGKAAVDDAIKAVRTHQATLVVGIKLALEQGVAAFNPENLEKQLASSSLQRLVPMSRKAALWDNFLESYRKLARDIDSDIRRQVGRILDSL